MTDILGALEDAEGQRGEEVARCQETGGGTQCETSVATQEVVHLLQLRNAVLDEDLLLLELCEDDIVFAASMLGHQVFDNTEN